MTSSHITNITNTGTKKFLFQRKSLNNNHCKNYYKISLIYMTDKSYVEYLISTTFIHTQYKPWNLLQFHCSMTVDQQTLRKQLVAPVHITPSKKQEIHFWHPWITESMYNAICNRQIWGTFRLTRKTYRKQICSTVQIKNNIWQSKLNSQKNYLNALHSNGICQMYQITSLVVLKTTI